MMKKLKKLLALASAVFIGSSALAADGWYPSYAQSDGSTSWNSIQSTLNAGGTPYIKFEKDLALFIHDPIRPDKSDYGAPLGLTFPSGIKATIDLNGHQINVAQNSNLIVIQNGAEVTFVNGTIGTSAEIGRIFELGGGSGSVPPKLTLEGVSVFSWNAAIANASTFGGQIIARNDSVLAIRGNTGYSYFFTGGIFPDLSNCRLEDDLGVATRLIGANDPEGTQLSRSTIGVGFVAKVSSTAFNDIKNWARIVEGYEVEYRDGECIVKKSGDPTKVTVEFSSQFGAGSVASIESYVGGTITLPSTGFTLAGAAQNGWSDATESTDKQYDMGAAYTIKAEKVSGGKVTMYPTWRGYASTAMFNPAAGSVAELKVKTGDKMEKVTPPTMAGKVFEGYYYGDTEYFNAAGEPAALNWLVPVDGGTFTLQAKWADAPVPANVVAKIAETGVEYGSINDAFAQAVAGQTVVMVKDATLAATCEIDKNVTFDLDGKRVGVADKAQFVVKQGCTLTLKTTNTSLIHSEGFPVPMGRIVPEKKTGNVRELALVNCEAGATLVMNSGMIASVNDTFEGGKDAQGQWIDLKKLNFCNGTAITIAGGANFIGNKGTVRGNPTFEVYGTANLQCCGASLSGNPYYSQSQDSYDKDVLPEGVLFHLNSGSAATVVMTNMHADCGGYIVRSESGAAGSVTIDDCRIESRHAPFFLDGTTVVNFNSGFYRDTNFAEDFGNYHKPVPNLIIGAAKESSAEKSLLINRGVKGFLANGKLSFGATTPYDYFETIVGTGDPAKYIGGERMCKALAPYLSNNQGEHHADHCVEVEKVSEGGQLVWPAYVDASGTVQTAYRYNCEIKVKPARIGEVYFDSLPLAVLDHGEYGESVTINLCRNSFGIGIQAGAPLTIDFSDDVEHGELEAHAYDVRTFCTDSDLGGAKVAFYVQDGGSGEFTLMNGTLMSSTLTDNAAALIGNRDDLIVRDMVLNENEALPIALAYYDATATIDGESVVKGLAAVVVGTAKDGQELFFDKTITIDQKALAFADITQFDCTKTLVERRKGLELNAPTGYYWAQSAKDDDIEVLTKIGVIQIPQAVKGLVYNGEEQIGVLEGEGYYLDGETWTDACNDLVTTAMLDDEEHTTWSDGSTTPKEIHWSIAPKPVTATVKVEPSESRVGDDKPVLSCDISGLVEEDAFSYDFVETIDMMKAGTYTVTIGNIKFTTGKESNYDVTVTPATFKVTGEIGRVDVPVAIKGLVYNGQVQTGVVATAGCTVADGSAVNAGTYTARADLVDTQHTTWNDAGYTKDQKTITWAIAKKNVEKEMASVTFNGATNAYTAADQKLELGGEPLPKGVEVAAITYLDADGNPIVPRNVGIYKAIVTFNYDTNNVEGVEEKTALLQITEAPLKVTAKDVTIAYGEPIPTTFEAVVEGLLGDDAEADNVTYTLSCAATSASEPGDYRIVVEITSCSANYKATPVDGTLKITGALEPYFEVEPKAESALIENQKLGDVGIVPGVVRVNGVEEPLEGTYAWVNPEEEPLEEDAKTNSYPVVFTPTDTKYKAITCDVPVAVEIFPELDAGSQEKIGIVIMKSADVALGRLVRGNIDEYGYFRSWALGISSGAAGKRAVRDNPYAYLSFALAQTRCLTEEEVKGKFRVTSCSAIDLNELNVRAGIIRVHHESIKVGPIADGDEVALNRLGHVYGAVGTRTLEGGWKVEGKAVCGAFRVDANGDVWYGVAPNTEGMEKQYFFCARFFPHCNALEGNGLLADGFSRTYPFDPKIVVMFRKQIADLW